MSSAAEIADKVSALIADKVSALIQAENKSGKDARDAACPILAESFFITRGKGQEENRDEYLDVLSDPKRPEEKRVLSAIEAVVDAPAVAVFRSIVTVDGAARYRNLHVLAIEDGLWKCVAWQVTGLPSEKGA